MKTISVFLGVLCLASIPTFAGVGDLTPAICAQGGELGLDQVYANYMQFAPAQKGDGTVNPHASVATVSLGGKEIKIAVDSAAADANAPDLFRLDFSGKGKFDGQPTIPLKMVKTQGNEDFVQGTLTATKIEVPRDGGTIPVWVSGGYYKYNKGTYRQLNLVLGTCLEGRCAFGSKVHPVRVIDGDDNLKPGDPVKPGKSRGYIRGDSLTVALGEDFTSGQTVQAYFGQPVQVDGAWYDVTVSADGKKVSAAKADIQTGQLKINHPSWRATLVGKKYILNLSGKDQPITVPADTYTVLDYAEASPADAAVEQPCLSCNGMGKEIAIDLPAGKLTAPAIGSPLAISLEARQSGATVNFSMIQADAAGLTVQNISGVGNRQPVLEVNDAGGKQVYTGTMEFG